MAIFNGEINSKALRRKTSICVVLPTDMENPPELLKSAYLLHGYTGHYTDWLYNLPLDKLALRFGRAFILLSGENHFYLNDTVRGAMYEDFLCKELPEFCRSVFRISPQPADTTVAGLSMGGYGAIHSGLAAPEVFGNIIALSSALITDKVAGMKEDQDFDGIAPFSYYKHVFGEPSKVLGSHVDPKSLAKKLAGKAEAPRMYMACGSEDRLVDTNRDFHRVLNEIAYEHVYVEAPGVHNGDFWNPHLVKGLEWLQSIGR